MQIAVIGTGYVGLVTGLVLADLGYDVICVDNDPEKVAKLSNGIPTIYEPEVEELLKRNIAKKRLRISDSVADATRASDVVFICVGTPPGPDGSPDTTAVIAVAELIGKNIQKRTVVVNKSTVPVGSGDLVENIIRSQGTDPSLFDVVSNPEFLREGSAVYDTLHPDRIVIGSKSTEAAQALIDIYSPLNAQVLVTDLESAEMIKYASNSFLAMKISFINAISRICERCGADASDVAKGMGMDQRIGAQFLGFGLGWGGSCFPKDVQGLTKVAEKLGYSFELLKAVWDINEDQTDNFVRRLEARIEGFSGKKIGLLGLAFKPNTDDIRDAKSLIIIEKLLKSGADVTAYDPAATDHVRVLYPEVRYCQDPYEVAQDRDALILVTEWNEFKHLDLSRVASLMRGNVLFDGRRVYTQQTAERAGLEYHTIGIASPEYTRT